MATAKAKPFIQNRSHLATSGTVLSNASTPGTLVPNWILPTFWTADRADGSPADVKSASNNSAPVDQANSDQAGVSESSIATSDRRDSKAELSGSWVAYASVIDRAGLEGATSSDAMNGSAVDRSADSSDKAKEVAQATTGPGEKDAKDVPLTQTPQSNANVSGNIPAVPGAKDANTSNTSAIPSPTALSNAANDAVNTLNVANAPVPSVPASTFVKPIEKALSHAAADAPTTVTQLKTESANSSQANLQSENGGTQQQSSQLDSGGSAKKQPNAAADPLLPAHAAVTAVQPGEAGAIARSVVTNVGVTSPDSTPQATTMANSTAALSAGSTGLSTGSASSSNATSASAQTSQPTSSAASPTAATSPTATAQVTRGQLIQHANQSEIRVSLDSTTLGPVEVRATMRNDTLSAAIGVTKSDVQTFLAAEWPSLHHTLAEHNLRVESLTLTDRSSDARSGLSQGSQQQNDRNFRPYLASVSTSSSAGENTNSLVAIPAEAPIGSTNGGRLSIHA